MLIEIPDIPIVCETVTDRFRGVDHTAAADSQKKINAFFFAEFDPLTDKREARIRNNTAELHIGDPGRIQGFFDPSEKTGADHTSASVVEQDLFTVYVLYESSDLCFGIFSENDTGRGIEIKVEHHTSS